MIGFKTENRGMLAPGLWGINGKRDDYRGRARPGRAELVILPASMREVPGQMVQCELQRKNRKTNGIREVPNCWKSGP